MNADPDAVTTCHQPDRTRLLLFVQQVEHLLGVLVDDLAARPSVPKEISRHVAAARRDLHHRIEALKTWLKKDGDAFNDLRAAGLAGAQLDLKYEGFRAAHSTYMGAVGASSDAREQAVQWALVILRAMPERAPGARALASLLEAGLLAVRQREDPSLSVANRLTGGS